MAIDDEMLDFPSSSPDKKVLTGRALLESGLVGIWKDRTDIGDTLVYVRKLRKRANKRRHRLPEHTFLSKEHPVATRRSSEPAEESIEGKDSTIPDDQKPKTGRELYKILTENGLIGMWKDRTDIGDTLEFVQKLKDEGRERSQEPLRTHTQE